MTTAAVAKHESSFPFFIPGFPPFLFSLASRRPSRNGGRNTGSFRFVLFRAKSPGAEGRIFRPGKKIEQPREGSGKAMHRGSSKRAPRQKRAFPERKPAKSHQVNQMANLQKEKSLIKPGSF
jgi:hypothetical protein